MQCAERINQFLVPMQKGKLDATAWATARGECDEAAKRLAEIPHGVVKCWAKFTTNTNNIVCEMLKGSDGAWRRWPKSSSFSTVIESPESGMNPTTD